MPTTQVKPSILITGCSSGIGLDVAKTLHQRGYRVFATVQKRSDLHAVQEHGFEVYHLDLNDTQSMTNTLKQVLECTNGTLDALFNNGAYGQPGAVEDLSREVLREQFECNLFGTHELTNMVIPIMRKQGHGRIIQNSSVLGMITLPYRGAYNASKFALEGLSDTLRLELHDTNIHVSIIEPGPITSQFRVNAQAAFEKNIDQENSAHRDRYKRVQARLKKEGDKAPFTLMPDAVTKKVIHALESKRPKIRYYVTFPTYLFGTLRRILPYRWLDKVLLKIAAGENK